jgi:HD superfamily phosphohydrolase
MVFYDPLYGKIEIPEFYHGIINSRFFRRLQYLRQLGLCYLAFPGGNHTRFEHSIGTFHLADLVSKGFLKSQIASNSELERLGHIIRIAALCHDLGHGPFSHMSENVLIGLGASISHEEIGAAIITHFLGDKLKPFSDFGITGKLIGSIITKGSYDDKLFFCARDLISSDLDLDRLDYLQRDSHYAGYGSPTMKFVGEIENIWQLNLIGQEYVIELTNSGVTFAEKILFLRRNNYQMIIFDSKHMSATGMFEKALNAALKSESDFSDSLNKLINTKMNWSNKKSIDNYFEFIWGIYGMVDYEGLKKIEESCEEARYLIYMIRHGKIFDSIQRTPWNLLHYSFKVNILSYKKSGDLFIYKRNLEQYLAGHSQTEDRHIVIHIPEIKLPKPLLFGVEGGKTLEEKTELGRFLHNDFLRQYAVEVFIDSHVDEYTKKSIKKLAEKILREGHSVY